MATSVRPLTDPKAWPALQQHYEQIRNLHLRQLFADDAKRGERLTASAAGVFLDYSKNRITDETLKLLLQFAEQSGVPERRDAMFRALVSGPRAVPSRHAAPARR